MSRDKALAVLGQLLDVTAHCDDALVDELKLAGLA
jgi:hypothetical protein